MVEERHIGEVFIKTYTEDSNKHLLFFLPGQSMSPRAFWDFVLDDESTHASYFCDNGIDVVLFDPVGYGKSTAYYPYDRIAYAEQIKFALKTIQKKYLTKTIVGFSTTTAPAILVKDHFDKVVIHSPSVRNDFKYNTMHNADFETGIDKLKKSRLEQISDKLIPEPNRILGWEEKIVAIMGTTWKVPAQVVYDINNYWVRHRKHGFYPDPAKEIFAIVGQYDYEITTGGYENFLQMFTHTQEIVIPNSTHFSMWENEFAKLRKILVEIACL